MLFVFQNVCIMEELFSVNSLNNSNLKRRWKTIDQTNLFSLLLNIFCFDDLLGNKFFLTVDFLKIQELSFLAEYFLITALFCLTLFFLFSITSFSNENRYFIKFQYDNQFFFLLVFILVCYFVLLYQQLNVSLLDLTSFNDTIVNDRLAIISKFIIGLTAILYLVFTNNYLKDQKLNIFEYYTILLVSIFGFFLLCSVNDFITAYLAIELQGLAFYVLASFKKSSNFSIESGVKYFVLGSLSTALFLFGITMVYGLCGSVLFTDFKDFFIWFFSAHSLFFGLDTFFTSVDVCQEKTIFTEDSSATKLEIFYNKLNVLEKTVDFSSVELGFLKPRFSNFDLDLNSKEKAYLYSNVAGNFFEYYNEINANSLLNFYDNAKLIGFNFFKVTFLLVSINDFLIENCYQNSSVDFLYSLQDHSVDYSGLKSLKPYLVGSSHYEDADFENFCEFSKTISVSDSLRGDSCLNSVYEFLECYYYSENLLNSLQIAGFSDITDSPESLMESLLSVESTGTSFFRSYLQKVVIDDTSIFSLIQIANLNAFFSGLFEVNFLNSELILDFSLLVVGFLMIIFALFFKLALAPFHLWSPDVYEGSPSSSTFFYMVLSKFSIFVLLLRLCYFSFYSLISHWQFYSLMIASISIFIGAVAGLKQRKLKSLLTYSSINNMGFVLLSFSVGSFEGVQVTFFYLIVYMLASVCIWSVILNLKLKTTSNVDKQNRDLGDLALLQESNSVLAQTLGITLFSLAGLPPMIGFFAKVGVFKALSGISIYYVSVLNILFSVVAAFYYLRIAKIIFFENILVGYLYRTVNSRKTFIINLLTFLIVFLFFNPMFLYLYSYKITLVLNKAFF